MENELVRYNNRNEYGGRIRVGRVVLLSFLFFYMMFRPPFIRIDASYIILLIDVIIIGFYCLNRNIKRLQDTTIGWVKNFIPFVIGFATLQICHIILDMENKGIYINAVTTACKIILYIVLTVTAMIAIKELFGLTFKEYIYILIFSMGLQLICVMAAFVIPSVKALFLGFLYKNSKNDVLVEATQKESQFRCYGLADNLFDSLGYISALCIVLIFAYGVRTKDRWATFLSIVYLIIPLLNARTGLLLALVGIVVVICMNLSAQRLMELILVGSVCIVISVILYSRLPESIRRWIRVGIEATRDLFSGEKNGVYEEILKADLVWPEHILWGAGASPENLGAYTGIDSGFVQCMWKYGIIGTALLFFGYLKLFSFRKDKALKKILLPIAVLFFLYLVKLFGISNYGSVLIVFVVPILLKSKTVAAPRLNERVNEDGK